MFRRRRAKKVFTLSNLNGHNLLAAGLNLHVYGMNPIPQRDDESARKWKTVDLGESLWNRPARTEDPRLAHSLLLRESSYEGTSLVSRSPLGICYFAPSQPRDHHVMVARVSFSGEECRPGCLCPAEYEAHETFYESQGATVRKWKVDDRDGGYRLVNSLPSFQLPQVPGCDALSITSLCSFDERSGMTCCVANRRHLFCRRERDHGYVPVTFDPKLASSFKDSEIVITSARDLLLCAGSTTLGILDFRAPNWVGPFCLDLKNMFVRPKSKPVSCLTCFPKNENEYYVAMGHSCCCVSVVDIRIESHAMQFSIDDVVTRPSSPMRVKRKLPGNRISAIAAVDRNRVLVANRSQVVELCLDSGKYSPMGLIYERKPYQISSFAGPLRSNSRFPMGGVPRRTDEPGLSGTEDEGEAETPGGPPIPSLSFCPRVKFTMSRSVPLQERLRFFRTILVGLSEGTDLLKSYRYPDPDQRISFEINCSRGVPDTPPELAFVDPLYVLCPRGVNKPKPLVYVMGIVLAVCLSGESLPNLLSHGLQRSFQVAKGEWERRLSEYVKLSRTRVLMDEVLLGAEMSGHWGLCAQCVSLRNNGRDRPSDLGTILADFSRRMAE